jgi:hypothetical protein
MAVVALATVADNVAGDRDDRDSAELVALDDRDAVEVDVPLEHGQGLADANTRAEHEGRDVRQVAAAGARLRACLLLVRGRPCHPGEEAATLLCGECAGRLRAALDGIEVTDGPGCRGVPRAAPPGAGSARRPCGRSCETSPRGQAPDRRRTRRGGRLCTPGDATAPFSFIGRGPLGCEVHTALVFDERLGEQEVEVESPEFVRAVSTGACESGRLGPARRETAVEELENRLGRYLLQHVEECWSSQPVRVVSPDPEI